MCGIVCGVCRGAPVRCQHAASSVEDCTWTHVQLEVLSDGADGREVAGVIEMFLHGFGRDFTKLILDSFSHAHSVHGDACVRAHKDHSSAATHQLTDPENRP